MTLIMIIKTAYKPHSSWHFFRDCSVDTRFSSNPTIARSTVCCQFGGALVFVGNCAPCRLSPQIGGMPVISEKASPHMRTGPDIILLIFIPLFRVIPSSRDIFLSEKNAVLYNLSCELPIVLSQWASCFIGLVTYYLHRR